MSQLPGHGDEPFGSSHATQAQQGLENPETALGLRRGPRSHWKRCCLDSGCQGVY